MLSINHFEVDAKGPDTQLSSIPKKLDPTPKTKTPSTIPRKSCGVSGFRFDAAKLLGLLVFPI